MRHAAFHTLQNPVRDVAVTLRAEMLFPDRFGGFSDPASSDSAEHVMHRKRPTTTARDVAIRELFAPLALALTPGSHLLTFEPIPILLGARAVLFHKCPQTRFRLRGGEHYGCSRSTASTALIVVISGDDW